MPDFAMPTPEELDAERQVQERARAAPDDAPAAASRRGARARASARIRPPLARADALRRRAARIARHPVVAFVAGAVLVAGAVHGMPQLAALASDGADAGPQQLVDDYVAAVVAGDVEAAVAMHMPEGSGASQAFLQAGIAPATPPVVTCEPIEVRDRDPDVATAQCVVAVLGGWSSGQRDALRLERVDGAWRIAVGLAQTVGIVPTGVDVVELGGVPIEPTSLGEPFWMLPGTYDVTTAPSRLLAVEPSSRLVVAGSGGGSGLDAWPRPSDALLAEVEAFALERLRACATGGDLGADDGPGSACSAIVAPIDPDALAVEALGDLLPFEDGVLVTTIQVDGTGSPLRPRLEVEVRIGDGGDAVELAVRERIAP